MSRNDIKGMICSKYVISLFYICYHVVIHIDIAFLALQLQNIFYNKHNILRFDLISVFTYAYRFYFMFAIMFHESHICFIYLYVAKEHTNKAQLIKKR